MVDVKTLAEQVVDDFVSLDSNEDGNISYIDELERAQIQGNAADPDQRFDALEDIAKSHPDNNLFDASLNDLANVLGISPTESIQQAVRGELERVFGAPVKISEIRDFNGFGNFLIKVAENKEGAERVVDNLIIARQRAGLEKKDFPFRTDQDGNIKIYAGDLTYLSSPSEISINYDVLRSVSSHRADFQEAISDEYRQSDSHRLSSLQSKYLSENRGLVKIIDRNIERLERINAIVDSLPNVSTQDRVALRAIYADKFDFVIREADGANPQQAAQIFKDHAENLDYVIERFERNKFDFLRDAKGNIEGIYYDSK